MRLKGKLFVLLLLSVVRILNDSLLSVNFKLFKLMTQHTLNRFTLVSPADLLYGSSYGVRLDTKETKFRLSDSVNPRLGLYLSSWFKQS